MIEYVFGGLMFVLAGAVAYIIITVIDYFNGGYNDD